MSKPKILKGENILIEIAIFIVSLLLFVPMFIAGATGIWYPQYKGIVEAWAIIVATLIIFNFDLWLGLAYWISYLMGMLLASFTNLKLRSNQW